MDVLTGSDAAGGAGLRPFEGEAARVQKASASPGALFDAARLGREDDRDGWFKAVL
jgi:hypothetical protein